MRRDFSGSRSGRSCCDPNGSIKGPCSQMAIPPGLSKLPVTAMSRIAVCIACELFTPCTSSALPHWMTAGLWVANRRAASTILSGWTQQISATRSGVYSRTRASSSSQAGKTGIPFTSWNPVRAGRSASSGGHGALRSWSQTRYSGFSFSPTLRRSPVSQRTRKGALVHRSTNGRS